MMTFEIDNLATSAIRKFRCETMGYIQCTVISYDPPILGHEFMSSIEAESFLINSLLSLPGLRLFTAEYNQRVILHILDSYPSDRIFLENTLGDTRLLKSKHQS
jgi:hypothetical protein